MTDGLWLTNPGNMRDVRPASKKMVREAIAEDPSRVIVECTSEPFGFPGFSGPLSDFPVGGKAISFVGPDPARKRSFYGTITRTAAGFKVS